MTRFLVVTAACCTLAFAPAARQRFTSVDLGAKANQKLTDIPVGDKPWGVVIHD